MKLQAEKDRIIQIIQNMPEKEAKQVINFVDDLDEDLGAPESVKVYDKKSLKNFLNKGLDDLEKGRTCSLDKTLKMIRSYRNVGR